MMSYLFMSRNSMNSRHMVNRRNTSTFCKYFSKSFCRCSKNCGDRLPNTCNNKLAVNKKTHAEQHLQFAKMTADCRWRVPFSVAINHVRCCVRSLIYRVIPQTLCIAYAPSNWYFQFVCGHRNMWRLDQWNKLKLITIRLACETTVIGHSIKQQMKSKFIMFFAPFTSTLLGIVMIVSCSDLM